MLMTVQFLGSSSTRPALRWRQLVCARRVRALQSLIDASSNHAHLNFCLQEGQHFVAINSAAQVWHTEWPQGMMRGQWLLSLKLSKHTMQGVVMEET